MLGELPVTYTTQGAPVGTIQAAYASGPQPKLCSARPAEGGGRSLVRSVKEGGSHH